jgi:hypothetical protein
LQARDQESRLLAELLRTSRLALLFGEEGSDKTALLKSGLMPLLRRRAGDNVGPVATRESGVVVPFPDRRRRASARAAKRRRELVVYFDDWAEAPLASLKARVHMAAATDPAELPAEPARLSETLALLGKRLDADFIILLDRFEAFLQAPSGREDITQFANELVEAINQAQLPANFLISLDEQARPRLAGLRGSIPGFDDFSLKLTSTHGPTPAGAPAPSPAPSMAVPAALASPPILTDALTAPTRHATPAPIAGAVRPSRPSRKPKVKREPPPRVVVHTEDVYALIEATLARTAVEPVSEQFVTHEHAGLASANSGQAYKSNASMPGAPPSMSGGSGVAGSLPVATAAVEDPVRAHGSKLHALVEWVARLVRLKSRIEPES